MTKLPVRAACVSLVLAACGDPTPDFSIQQQIRFSFTLRNTSGELLRDSELRVFAPVKALANQRTERIESSHPYELLEDDLGNQVLRFRVTIPPWSSAVVDVRADVALAEHPNEVALDDTAPYLASAPYIEVDDSRILETAQALSGRGNLAVARAAYEWVSGNLSDPGYVEKDLGAAAALQARAGDCTERMYLFAALARVRQIPTRAIGGFVTHGDAFVRAGDYHNWAEFYADDAWRIADPLKGEFDTPKQRYVAMRILDPRAGDTLGSAQRFVAFNPRLEVRMN